MVIQGGSSVQSRVLLEPRVVSLASAAAISSAQAIAIAGELGIEMTPEDFVIKAEERKELSDDELDAVAGGGGACACSGGGYGDSWGNTDGKCVCVLAGAGNFQNNPTPDFDWDDTPFSEGDGSCWCAGPGAGACG